MSSTASSSGDYRRGWTGDTSDTGLLNSSGRDADWDDHTGICCGNDFRARSSRAAELLSFRVLGSFVPSCIAGARQAEQRQVSRVEESAQGTKRGLTCELKKQGGI